MTVTYFDIVAAIRYRRTLRFTTAGETFDAMVAGITLVSRPPAMIYNLNVGAMYPNVSWTEDASSPTQITEIP